MMKYYNLLFLLIITLSGCKSLGGVYLVGDSDLSYRVEGEYYPLKYIRQRPDIVSKVGVSETAIATIGQSAYVSNLDKWLAKHTPGTINYKAVMLHEQKHSERQHKRGVFLWVCQYSYDRKFMLKEEQIGWYYEITTLRSAGVTVSPDGVAAILSNYRNIAGKMIGFEDAKRWVLEVITGAWKPPTN